MSDAVTTFFAHFCGQGRCFVVDGAPLPVCQRCFGLYAGAVLTALWLLGGGLWRCGLPARRVIAAHALLLIAAMLGGLHVLDGGPAWRVTCGLWTGHVALIWLLCGAVQLRSAAHLRGAPPGVWSRRHTIGALLAGPLLVLIGLIATAAPPAQWWCWTAFVIAGAAALLAAALDVLITLLLVLAARVRRRRGIL